MELIDLRLQRAHEAGIRLAMTETEVADSILSKTAGLSDPKERVRSLREARATVELAARLVSTMPLADSRCDEIWSRIQQLRERLDALTTMFPVQAARRSRPRAVSRSL